MPGVASQPHHLLPSWVTLGPEIPPHPSRPGSVGHKGQCSHGPLHLTPADLSHPYLTVPCLGSSPTELLPLLSKLRNPLNLERCPHVPHICNGLHVTRCPGACLSPTGWMTLRTTSFRGLLASDDAPTHLHTMTMHPWGPHSPRHSPCGPSSVFGRE